METKTMVKITLIESQEDVAYFFDEGVANAFINIAHAYIGKDTFEIIPCDGGIKSVG